MLLDPIEIVPADQVGPVHFIAAGGSGMSGIARLYSELGIRTSGSDQSDSTALQGLARAGVRGDRSAARVEAGRRGAEGPGGRTHLVSPLVAAATAVTGHLSSPADLPAVN